MNATAVQMLDVIPEAKELVTPKEAARLLKDRNLKTIYRLIERGKLAAWKIVGRLYVRRDDVLACIEPVEPKPVAPVESKQPKELEKLKQQTLQRARIPE